ncbi:serine esterase family protein, partial [Trifolium medium]|nr:serine esterase family protein [Trifolium medium]
VPEVYRTRTGTRYVSGTGTLSKTEYTSSIRRQHELPKSNLQVIDEKYPHIVHAKSGTVDDISSKESTNVGGETIDME